MFGHQGGEGVRMEWSQLFSACAGKRVEAVGGRRKGKKEDERAEKKLDRLDSKGKITDIFIYLNCYFLSISLRFCFSFKIDLRIFQKLL